MNKKNHRGKHRKGDINKNAQVIIGHLDKYPGKDRLYNIFALECSMCGVVYPRIERGIKHSQCPMCQSSSPPKEEYLKALRNHKEYQTDHMKSKIYPGEGVLNASPKNQPGLHLDVYENLVKEFGLSRWEEAKENQRNIWTRTVHLLWERFSDEYGNKQKTIDFLT